MALSDDYGLELGVAHFHHGMRQDAAAKDAAFVEKTARRLSLPFYFGKKSAPRYARRHRLSLEEAGRCLRYEFLEKTAADNGYGPIALGHHLQDNAEQVLMNLIRGAGPLGLAGIPPRRGSFIRPLIQVDKEEILAFLSAGNIPYQTDATNNDPRFVRNRVRGELLPLLKNRFNPNVVRTLARSAEVLGREEAWLSHLAREAETRCLEPGPANTVRLNLKTFNALDPALGRRVVRRAVQKVKTDLRRVTRFHVEAVMELAASAISGRGLDLPGGVGAGVKDGRLVFSKEKSRPRPPDFSLFIPGPGAFQIPEINASIRVERIGADEAARLLGASGFSAVVDEDKAPFPFRVRPVCPGDRFTPLGCPGTQKLKKFFIDHKVPPEDRRRALVFESGGDIVWVAGHRIDHGARIRSGTKKALVLEVFLA